MSQRHTSSNKNLYETDQTVGAILKRERLRYDQSITDIEHVLHIRAAQLEAIEADQFQKLPGPVYAAGFIRTYAEYLGLDGPSMVSLYKSQSGARTIKPDLHIPVMTSESRTPRVWQAVASLVAIIVIMGFWFQSESHDRTIVTSVPSVAVLKEQAPHSSENNYAVAAAVPKHDMSLEVAGPPVPSLPAVPQNAAVTTTTPEEAATQKGIILKIVQNSWVEIKDSAGRAVVSRVLQAGDKYFVPSRPDLMMSLGNSGGVEIEIDGVSLSALGERGQVLRNIPLDSGFLKSRFSKRIANPVQ